MTPGIPKTKEVKRENRLNLIPISKKYSLSVNNRQHITPLKPDQNNTLKGFFVFIAKISMNNAAIIIIPRTILIVKKITPCPINMQIKII